MFIELKYDSFFFVDMFFTFCKQQPHQKWYNSSINIWHPCM